MSSRLRAQCPLCQLGQREWGPSRHRGTWFQFSKRFSLHERFFTPDCRSTSKTSWCKGPVPCFSQRDGVVSRNVSLQVILRSPVTKTSFLILKSCPAEFRECTGDLKVVAWNPCARLECEFFESAKECGQRSLHISNRRNTDSPLNMR